MAITKKPGESTGNKGGIYQEVGPRGGRQPNYTTVPDNRQLPPTTKPGHAWTPVKVTPPIPYSLKIKPRLTKSAC